jgi:hypothetical protein
MNRPAFDRPFPPDEGLEILLAVPRYIVLMFAGSLLLNGFATAILASALVAHLAGNLVR